MEKIGLLVMAYGSPNSLDEIEPYLLDIRGGRPTSQELVEEIKGRYARIGGRSPLLHWTIEQASALEEELNRRFKTSGLQFQSYVGMRHWEPRIREAVAGLASDGLHTAVGLVMAPHSSRLSTGGYFARLEEAVADLDAELKIHRIESWHDHPGLIGALSEKVEEGLRKFDGADPFVLYTAHSLPKRILSEGDPYDRQLNETARLVADRLSLPSDRWRFCYQSAGHSQEPWLGPQLEEVIPELAAQGEKELLVAPIGFVCDHVEILFDIDIEAQELAQNHGLKLERTDSLNASPAFITALADIVSDTIR